MTSILAILRESTPDRHQKAVRGLADGTLTVTLVKQSDAEIRALVKNGSGLEYRVIINDAGSICSCPDAFYHRGPCKHAAAVCIFSLQRYERDNHIHLMWASSGMVLCGEQHPTRFWQNWTLNALNWPDVCPLCVHVWTHPAVAA